MKINKQAVEIVVGATIGLLIRKQMVNKGMVKSFWKPGMIRKPGTFNK